MYSRADMARAWIEGFKSGYEESFLENSGQVCKLSDVELEAYRERNPFAARHGSLCGCGQCSGYGLPPCCKCGARDHGLPECRQLQGALEQLAAAAIAWRRADEDEPIGSHVPSEKLRTLALAIDELHGGKR